MPGQVVQLEVPDQATLDAWSNLIPPPLPVRGHWDLRNAQFKAWVTELVTRRRVNQVFRDKVLVLTGLNDVLI